MRGVENGELAYVGRTAAGKYDPFYFRQRLNPADIEFSADRFIIKAETAQAYLAAQPPVVIQAETEEDRTGPGTPTGDGAEPGETKSAPNRPLTLPAAGPPTMAGPRWSGEVPLQKWVLFYNKVLARFAHFQGVTLTVTVEVSPSGGLPALPLEEMRSALRELGLDDRVTEM